MSWKHADKHEGFAGIVDAMPDGTYYFFTHERECEMQAATHEDFAVIRATFPGVVWHKEWNAEVNWFEYKGKRADGWKFRVYAIMDGPKHCTPIKERIVEKRRVPTAWAIETIERERIVGYDCGGEEVDVE